MHYFPFMNNYCFKNFGKYLKSEKSSDLKIYFFLFLITIAGYYNISFFIHPLKWDMIDQVYPYRYYIGECLKNNYFPYWMPYQLLGLPVCADPQGGVWYPFTWLIGLFAGYNIYTISVEYILHIFFASIGFYVLSKNTGFSKWTAFILAICYMFSGFIVGNSQHLSYIIAATWIPYILNSYILLIKRKKFFHAITTAFFLFLLATGGYPAFWIILGYHLLVIFIAYSVWLFIRKRYKDFIQFFKLNSVALIVFGLLALSFFVSVLYNKDQIGRFGSTSLEDALSNPFSPQCSLSFIAPYSVAGNAEFLNTDVSMANAYFGIFSLAFFLLYFFQKKSRISIVILIIGFINLLFAFGGYLPFRGFLFHYLPLMNMFRFPSVFRYFAIVAFLLTTGFSMQYFFDKKNKSYLYILGSIILLFCITIITLRINGYLNLKNITINLAWQFPNDTTVAQRAAFHLIIQSALLVCFLLINYLKKIKIQYLILGFVLIDLLIATKLNSPCTVYYDNFRSKEIRTFENQNFIHGFPAPLMPVSACSDSTGAYQCFWRNLSIFYQRPAYDGYNPFQIRTYTNLVDYQGAYFKKIKQNKLFYFADTLIKNFDSITANNFGQQGMVFTENDFPFFQQKKQAGQNITIAKLTPSSAQATAVCSDSCLLVFFQNFNKGWLATINNNPTKIYRVNHTLNSVILPPGKNEITFSYKPQPIIIARFISQVSLILVVFCLIVFRIKKTAKDQEKT